MLLLLSIVSIAQCWMLTVRSNLHHPNHIEVETPGGPYIALERTINAGKQKFIPCPEYAKVPRCGKWISEKGKAFPANVLLSGNKIRIMNTTLADDGIYNGIGSYYRHSSPFRLIVENN